jgi:hypothetical protein
MPDWPPIDEPVLLRRLALTDAEFAAHLLELAAQMGPREHTAKAYARALGYPWERPARSYLLAGGEVTLLQELDAAQQADVLTAHTGPASARLPLLAFGSNAAPATLRLKFGHFEAGPDRDVLVLAGALHGFDVGAAAHPTLYGALPATLFESPGTAVRAALLWVTPAQFVQLTWSELTYRLGRLDGVRFAADEDGADATGVLAYVSRLGTFCPDGQPAALAAIPATGRTAPALTQEQLLDAAAGLAFGPGATAERVVRGMFEDAAGFIRDIGPAIRAAGRPFAAPAFRPYPASARLRAVADPPVAG